MSNTEIDTNQLYKNYDKLYYEISRYYSKSRAETIINSIAAGDFLGYIIIALKIQNYENLRIVIDAAKRIKYFRDIIFTNITSILMSSVNSSKSMKIALELEESFCKEIKNKDFNENVIICILRHSLNFPENKELCISCIRKYDLEKLATTKNLFFFKDNEEIISKYLSKNDDVKNKVIKNCIENDAVDTLNKCLKYYKLPNRVYANFSYPTFLKLKSKIDFSNKENIDYLISHASMYSRFEYVKYIFDNIELNDYHLSNFRTAIYNGYTSLPFLQTLIFYLRKFNIPVDKVVSRNRPLMTTKEIKTYLLEENLYDNEKTIDTNVSIVDDYSGEPFKAFRTDLVFYTKYIYAGYIHLNNRFLPELECINTMFKNDEFGWDDKIKRQFTNYYDYTHRFVNQLNILEKAVMEYNSLVALHSCACSMLALRCINSIIGYLKDITFSFLLDEYDKIVSQAYLMHQVYIKEVRSILNIDLPFNIKWELPSNFTLEDLFIDLYQNSSYDIKNFNVEDATDLLETLDKYKFVKIKAEVERAFKDFVSPCDIRKILRIKGIKV